MFVFFILTVAAAESAIGSVPGCSATRTTSTSKN
jgi:NADH:ubiquinone oxidoreductase subunit K